MRRGIPNYVVFLLKWFKTQELGQFGDFSAILEYEGKQNVTLIFILKLFLWYPQYFSIIMKSKSVRSQYSKDTIHMQRNTKMLKYMLQIHGTPLEMER